MTWKRAAGLGVLMVLVSVGPAAAQRVEVSAIFGGTFSDGVDGDGVLAGDGNIYDEINLADSASWGFAVGFLASDNAEVGFLFGQQMSSLELKGTSTRGVGDITVTSYHPYVAYNIGDVDAGVRPYFLLGLGATHYGSASFNAGGTPRETGTQTQFSTTWGAGVKLFFAPNVGARVGLQWTPTYIKSDADGWWCDPWFGCYVVGDAQYSNQFQFNGGITFRF